MDLFYLGYCLALFLIPFIIYSLLFKTNNGRSVYTNRDWFYLIKFYYAKKAVKKYQKEYRLRVESLENGLETEVDIPTKEHSNYLYIYGADQNDNSLSLKLILRHKKIAEAILSLRLADGNEYTFPGDKYLYQTTVPKEKWKINGLNIEILEPLKRCRIIFNGLLQNRAVKDYEKVEHVRFNLIFNASGRPTYIPHGVDTNLLAEALATEPWKDGAWADNLVDQFGYQQFGALQGYVKGDSYPNEYLLNLPACRSIYRGIDDRFLLNRGLRIFFADSYGNLIDVVIKSFKNGCSQLNYGSVILSNSRILPLTGVDILLDNVGRYRSIPDMITTHIQVKSKVFRCIIHLNLLKTLVSTNNEEFGYELYSVPAQCDMDDKQSRGVVEFWYSKEGSEKFVNTVLLHEKTVPVLPDKLMLNISDDESKIVELVGGKGASLSLLSSLNSKDFIVPAGFIITVNAFQKQLKSSPTLTKALSHLYEVCCGKKSGDLEDACKDAVRCFKKEKILPEILHAIVDELHKQRDITDSGDTVGWAVRSSAVGEDSEELSAAGQNETFLGCLTDEDIFKSITACWASLYTYQSVQYRWQHGLPVLSDMAVVVQKMVAADSAGVLFTWHPSTSNPSQMVITSNYGLGETVVSGQSEPDTFILNRTWDGKVCLIDSSIGAKNKVIKMTKTGLEEIDTTKELELIVDPAFSISQQQAVRLGKVGVLLEKAFGGPRDIEWAYHKEKLYLLQSRPITTLSSWSNLELTHELDYPILTDKSVFTLANVGEVFPKSMTVLTQTNTISLLERALQNHMEGCFDPFSSKCCPTIQHRAMLDVIGCLHKNVHKEIKVSSKILDLAMCGHPVLDEKINDMAINKLGLTPPLYELKETLRIANITRMNEKSYKEMKECVAKFKIDIKVNDSSSEIYKKIGGSFNDVYWLFLYHYRTSTGSVFYQMIAMNILSTGCEDLTPVHYADFALILSSCEDVISAEIPTYLEKIAKIIRNEGYNEEFCTLKPEFGVAWLKNKCPEAYKLFEKFITKHGHRNLGEFELIEESWGENPSTVIQMIQANAKHENNAVKHTKSIDEIIRNLVSPKNTTVRRILKFIAKRIRVAVGLRELTKSELVQALHIHRMAYRQLAKQMVLEGILPSPDLIYHLTYYEIGQVIQKRNPLLITKAVKRQRLYPKWCKQTFPEVMFGIPAPEKEDTIQIDSAAKVCVGTPACTGSVKARACVIQSLNQINELQSGDILITFCTDIGWSPYFPILSGIVTELGGLISHGAVIAREYGLPCIVGVKNATKVFKTGDIVILSGSTGELAKA